MPDTSMSPPAALNDALRPSQAYTAPVEFSEPLDIAACEELMRGGSKSFFAASRVLPQRVRCAAIALYAFCRVADDAIDLSSEPQAAVADLTSRLDGIYAGRPRPIDADRALAAVVHRHHLPRDLLDALIEGFQWDAQGRTYDTLAQVEDYGARVAGTVGAMMAILMGTRSAQAIARACELGVAMQLTNIARDVGEDARNGRLYLPRDWLRQEGIDPETWLRAPVFNDAIGRVTARLLQAAERLYERARAGVAELPRDCRPAIESARIVYAEIGREIERAGHDSVSRRAVVSGRRKLALMARAMGVLLPTLRSIPTYAPLPAIQYLVRASQPDDTLDGARGSPYQRTIWVIKLCERVDPRARGGVGSFGMDRAAE
jgi:15-cis-phytoene synthase